MQAIVAINKKGVIGHDGGIPWPMNKQDMRHFVKVTNAAQEIITGRKTWESLPSKARARLSDDRIVRVISNANESMLAQGVTSIQPASIIHRGINVLAPHYPHQRVVIGGAQTYALLAPAITCWHVTTLDNDADGDTTLEPYWLDGEVFGLYKSTEIDGGIIQTYRRWM